MSRLAYDIDRLYTATGSAFPVDSSGAHTFRFRHPRPSRCPLRAGRRCRAGQRRGPYGHRGGPDRSPRPPGGGTARRWRTGSPTRSALPVQSEPSARTRRQIPSGAVRILRTACRRRSLAVTLTKHSLDSGASPGGQQSPSGQQVTLCWTCLSWPDRHGAPEGLRPCRQRARVGLVRGSRPCRHRAWTASVAFRQASTCAAECRPGVVQPWPPADGWVPSVMIRPALARWAQ